MHKDLQRLQTLLSRLTGDKAVRDEAVQLVQQLLAVSPAFDDWWETYGPKQEWKPGHPLPPQSRRLIDFIRVSGEATPAEIAANLEIDEDYARRLVSRTSTRLLDTGANATISISGGVCRTAAMTAIGIRR